MEMATTNLAEGKQKGTCLNQQYNDCFPLTGLEQGDQNRYDSQIHRKTKHTYLKKKTRC